ncbi:Uncharacterised protein [Propionibacterium australiense]|uniref:Uncharacterized protein n=1 Tax=Propionibacterium australiense TaxID=119981 RepID=A0A383S880_9ACTN|nr:Hypothetical protein PROPAUS_1543 [Propionibacterium australiense]VEH88822.1 Uncharacterised protein [Propionibacterium australiense]
MTGLVAERGTVRDTLSVMWDVLVTGATLDP